MAQKRGPGRPPAGKQGEKVSSYPPFTLRLPPDRKAELDALAFIRGLPAWQVVDEALQAHLRALPASERALVRKIVLQKSKPRS